MSDCDERACVYLGHSPQRPRVRAHVRISVISNPCDIPLRAFRHSVDGARAVSFLYILPHPPLPIVVYWTLCAQRRHSLVSRKCGCPSRTH